MSHDASKFLSFDLESALIQPGLLTPPMVCGSFAVPKGASLHDRKQTLKWFANMISDNYWTWVGANIAYDFGVMAAELPETIPDIFKAYDEGRVFDVQIAQALDAVANGHLGKDPRSGGSLRDPSTGKITNRYSLAVCVDLVLGRVDAKANDYWRLRYALLADKPIDQWPAEARQYPIDDAVNTLEVALAQVKTHKNLHDMPAQAYAAWCMHLGAIWGLKTDAVAVSALAERIDKEYAETVKKFTAVDFLRDDGTENQAVIKARVSEAYNGTPPTTPKGGVSKARDVLAESGDDLLEEYASAGERSKIRTTYLPLLKTGSTTPINVRPNILLETGRASYDGIVQQMPRSGGVRECFVPRDGYLFVSCDYSSLELCTLAQVCFWTVGKSSLGDAINAGIKVHDSFAASMLGMDYQDYLARRKSDKRLGDYRQAAKAANFGFPGGMGAPKFVLAKRREPGTTTAAPDGRVYKGLRLCLTIGDADICGEEKVTEWRGRSFSPLCKRCIECAEQLRKQWFAEWPEMSDYFRYVSHQVDCFGEIEQLVSKRVRGGVEFTQAANGYFQGLAADGAKYALREVVREAYCDNASPLYGTRPVLFLHDEIFAEVPESRTDLAARRLSTIMVQSMRRFCPDVAIEAEPALMDRWTKAAEKVENEQGELIPWTTKS